MAPINLIGPDGVLRSTDSPPDPADVQGKSIVDVLFAFHDANLSRDGDRAAIVEVRQEGQEDVHARDARLASELRPMCSRVANAMISMGLKKVTRVLLSAIRSITVEQYKCDSILRGSIL